MILCLSTACREVVKREGILQQPLVTVEDSLLLPDSLWKRGWLETETEYRMRKMGLVDVGKLDATIRVCLRYADSANFTGKVLYTDLHKAFLLPEAAKALVSAQQELKRLHPELSLIVYDAARPLSVQQIMWDKVKGTPQQNFVSNPARGGGLHNYGVAVDVSIVDACGNPLDMGCDFDSFDERAGMKRERELLKEGKLTQQQIDNRLLLRRVMISAGFALLPGEWWHFNLVTRQEAVRSLNLIK